MERRKADPSLGATPQLNLKQTLLAIKRFPPTFRNLKVSFIKYDFQQLHTNRHFHFEPGHLAGSSSLTPVIIPVYLQKVFELMFCLHN
jgi:hypothetical protein